MWQSFCGACVLTRRARQGAAILQIAAGVTVTSTGGTYAWSSGTIAGAGTVTFVSALVITGSVSLSVDKVWFALAPEYPP